MLKIVLLCVIYVLLFLLLLYVLSCIFFVFPRYDKKLTCCVFDPSLFHPTSHHELARHTCTFIYKNMYLRDLEEDSFHSYIQVPQSAYYCINLSYMYILIYINIFIVNICIQIGK